MSATQNGADEHGAVLLPPWPSDPPAVHTVLLRGAGRGTLLGAASAAAVVMVAAMWSGGLALFYLPFALGIGGIYGLFIGTIAGAAYLPFRGREPARLLARAATATGSAGGVAVTLLWTGGSSAADSPSLIAYLGACGYVAVVSFIFGAGLADPEPPPDRRAPR